ncbi:hypothetical protein NBE98_15730 [Clostridium swellfunianum]|uniref:hypothetical protein n=1 Tax=Clostridium swellfunianum TaxID=1367462 RepID=UPI0020306732|nr:hypothetical protein [Clostridium swellfunianum]MCM0649817.1 hypothetical protein [Clostridium swellfunianum]
MNRRRNENKNIENGKIKGTSAFNIKQADSIDEMSWSNNKFESTCGVEGNDSKDQE